MGIASGLFKGAVLQKLLRRFTGGGRTRRTY
jgi:hypothetical protein